MFADMSFSIWSEGGCRLEPEIFDPPPSPFFWNVNALLFPSFRDEGGGEYPNITRGRWGEGDSRQNTPVWILSPFSKKKHRNRMVVERFRRNRIFSISGVMKSQVQLLYGFFFVCGEAQTMEWSVLLLLLLLFFFFFLLALLSYYRIYERYRKTYKNKSVDTSDTRYCAKFQPFVTSIFAKNRQKRFCVFSRFRGFLPFWPLKWPQNSNLTWSAQHNLGVPDLFCFIKKICTITLCAFKIHFKILFYFFHSIVWTLKAIFGQENILNHLKMCWQLY